MSDLGEFKSYYALADTKIRSPVQAEETATFFATFPVMLWGFKR